MSATENIITRAGYERYQEELADREGRIRQEILDSLAYARSQGDLSENAEYDAARDEQARNEARISELRAILTTAKIVEEGDITSVSIGSVVEVEDDRGRRESLQIVGTNETNSIKKHISNESPAGSALMGHAVGDTVSFTIPNGRVRTFRILNISLPN